MTDAGPAGAGSRNASSRPPLVRRLPRRGPLRALIKRAYYSPRFRDLTLGPLDAVEGALGLRPDLLPPRRLRYVGGRGDFHAIGRRWRDYLVSEQGVGAGTDVLEIGCGAGRLAIALAEVLGRNGSYEGFDIVPDAIEWCEQEITSRHPNCRFRSVDIESGQYNPGGARGSAGFEFPYGDGRFDIALAMSVFSHMKPDGMARYLAETSRVLRPGGRLVATYFLVDRRASARLGTGETDFALDHELRDASGTSYLASDPRVPEYNVGHRLEAVEAAVSDAGLELLEHRPGWWSQRLGEPRGEAFYQDLLVLGKPAR